MNGPKTQDFVRTGKSKLWTHLSIPYRLYIEAPSSLWRLTLKPYQNSKRRPPYTLYFFEIEEEVWIWKEEGWTTEPPKRVGSLFLSHQFLDHFLGGEKTHTIWHLGRIDHIRMALMAAILLVFIAMSDCRTLSGEICGHKWWRTQIYPSSITSRKFW